MFPLNCCQDFQSLSQGLEKCALAFEIIAAAAFLSSRFASSEKTWGAEV